MPLKRRLDLRAVCRRHDVFILEDNPYGMFLYEGERLPTLKALDRDGTVLYIGSLSKILFPSLRLGFLIADQAVSGVNRCLAEELSKVKSLMTVNTPALSPALAAGALTEAQYSLKQQVLPQVEQLRQNRNRLLASLSSEFHDVQPLIRWNRPQGGFFLTLTLPFPFGIEEMRLCAMNHGVLVCPMTFFSLGPGRETQVRLSFSCSEGEQIKEGIHRFSRFVHDRLRAHCLVTVRAPAEVS